MSEPQLKLVWVNNLVMATSSEKRKQKADALKREDSNETKDSAKLEDSDGIKDSGWTSSFDRKQIVSTLVGVIAGTILGVLGAAVFGIWSMSSENWENRLIKKVGESDTLATKIAEKVEQSKTLPAAIVAQLKNTDEFKSVKTATDELGKIRERVAKIEGQVDILEKIPTYRSKSAALGIKDANIQTIALRPKESFTAPSITIGNFAVVVQYTIISVKDNVISLRVDGRDSRNNVSQGNIFTVRAEPGKVIHIGRLFPGWPALSLAILDRPTADTAVVAAGPSDPPRS